MIPHKDDPTRPGDWRWLRAAFLIKHRRYARPGDDDEDTLTIKRYQLARARCIGETGELYISHRHPGLYWAERVRSNLNHDARWIIEARLLAEEPLESIATKVSCSRDTVLWYEKAFFNVLPYLEQGDYIVSSILGKSAQQGIRERDYDLLWKLYGYTCGPHMLDAVICPFGRKAHILGPDQVDAAQNDIVRGNLRNKAVLASSNVPVAYNQMHILETWTKLQEIEKNNSGDSAQRLIVTNISAAITSLRFTTERPAEVEPSLAYYDLQSAELRANELIDVASGNETEAHRQAVQLKFPDVKEAVHGRQADHQGS